MSVLPLAIVILASALTPADSGFLTVKSNLPGVAVYLDGGYLGRTPVEMHQLTPGNYSVSIVSDDSLENVYWHIRQGPLGGKLSSLWALAAINAGTHSVRVEAGKVTLVSIDYGRVLSAPAEAKLIACCSLGGLFLTGAAVGFLVHLLASR